MDHLVGDSCPGRGCREFSIEVCPGDSPVEVPLGGKSVPHLAG